MGHAALWCVVADGAFQYSLIKRQHINWRIPNTPQKRNPSYFNGRLRGAWRPTAWTPLPPIFFHHRVWKASKGCLIHTWDPGAPCTTPILLSNSQRGWQTDWRGQVVFCSQLSAWLLPLPLDHTHSPLAFPQPTLQNYKRREKPKTCEHQREQELTQVPKGLQQPTPHSDIRKRSLASALKDAGKQTQPQQKLELKERNERSNSEEHTREPAKRINS